MSRQEKINDILQAAQLAIDCRGDVFQRAAPSGFTLVPIGVLNQMAEAMDGLERAQGGRLQLSAGEAQRIDMAETVTAILESRR